MSLGTTEGWLGAIIISNLYMDRLSISHFTTSASIPEYWQGMMSDLIDFLVLIWLRISWSPHKYVSWNHRGVAWWYNHLQLVSGEFEYIPLHYKCFHHWVLAGYDVSSDILPNVDPSKNILVATPLWVLELQGSGLVVWTLAIGTWTDLSMSHFTTSASITENWQGMMSVLIFFLSLICLRVYWWPHHYEFWNYRGVAWWYGH